MAKSNRLEDMLLRITLAVFLKLNQCKTLCEYAIWLDNHDNIPVGILYGLFTLRKLPIPTVDIMLQLFLVSTDVWPWKTENCCRYQQNNVFFHSLHI